MSQHLSNAAPAKPNRLLAFALWLANARSATFSLFVHFIILLTLGTIVLHSPQDDAEDFVGGDGSVLIPSENLSPPPEQPSEAATPAEPTVTPPTASPTMAVMATTTPSSTFQVKTAVSISPLGSLQGTDALKGTGDDKTLTAGLGTGLGGMGPGMGRGRFFGAKTQLKTGSLVGRFYDLKQTRSRKPSGVSPDEYHKIFRKFVKEDWNPSILNDYFRSPKALYTTQIMIPNMSADEGPKAFELEKEVQPSRWLVHYEGRVSPSENGIFHFVGAGDDVMVVRFNGKVVLDRCWYQNDQEWQPKKNYNYGWTGIPNGFAVGDAIEVKAGE